MPSLTRRKVSRIGTGYALFLPIDWLRYHAKEQGKTLEEFVKDLKLDVVSDGVITIHPPGDGKKDEDRGTT